MCHTFGGKPFSCQVCDKFTDHRCASLTTGPPGACTDAYERRSRRSAAERSFRQPRRRLLSVNASCPTKLLTRRTHPASCIMLLIQEEDTCIHSGAGSAS